MLKISIILRILIYRSNKTPMTGLRCKYFVGSARDEKCLNQTMRYEICLSKMPKSKYFRYAY